MKRILNKILKILQLEINNENKDEAQIAILEAQKLISKCNITYPKTEGAN